MSLAVDALINHPGRHTDRHDSVRSISGAAGSVTQTYRTDEFGVPIQSQGTRSQPFQYTGEQRDDDSGFVYLRARMYDPQIGRFLRDSFAWAVEHPLSLNRLAFALPNPIGVFDSNGLVPTNLALVDRFHDCTGREGAQVKV